MTELGPLLILATVAIASLMYWGRFKDEDTRREIARKISQQAADEFIRHARRSFPMWAWVLIAAGIPLGFQGAHYAGLGPGIGGLGTIFGGSRGRSGGGSPAFEYGAPNTPTIDAAVLTGDTLVRLTISTPVFSGDDTHDSTGWWITGPSGASAADTALSSFADADSLEAITLGNLIPDSTYMAHVHIIGANGGVSGDDSVTFTPTSSGHANEPVGFSELTTNTFTGTLTPTGWSDFSSDLSLGSDGTAPQSPSGVGDARWTAACACNPTNLRYESISNAQVYIHFWLKFESGWVQQPNNNAKLFLVGNNNHDDVIVSVNGNGSGPINVNLTTQNVVGGAAIHTANETGTALTRGSWDEVEVWIQIDSTPAAEDGEFKIWVNGTLTHDYNGASAVSLTRTGDDADFDYLSWEMSVGGASGWPSSEQHLYIDEIYISGN